MSKMNDLTAAMDSTINLIRDKADKFLTVARLKLELAEQRAKLKKYYTVLGKLTYRRARGLEDTVDMDGLMEDIDTLREGIAAIRYLLSTACTAECCDDECCCETEMTPAAEDEDLPF